MRRGHVSVLYFSQSFIYQKRTTLMRLCSLFGIQSRVRLSVFNAHPDASSGVGKIFHRSR